MEADLAMTAALKVLFIAPKAPLIGIQLYIGYKYI